jgi:uncharacterized protein with HEPN domain
MPPDDTTRLRHLRDAAEQALDFVVGRSRPDLDSDPMLSLALTKLVEIIGEAAKQVSPETRARFPACPGLLQPEVAVFAVIVASKVEFVEARP